eukprot:gene5462-5601_t
MVAAKLREEKTGRRREAVLAALRHLFPADELSKH